MTAGRGAVLVGQSGTGRTSMIELVARQLPAARHAVYRATATEIGRVIPFGVFAQLLPDTGGGALNPGQIRDQLILRGRPRTPLLVVDDTHWVDAQTANTLLGLAHDGRIRLLLTTREDVHVPDAVVALWKDRHLRRIDLPPLGVDETTALLRCRLGGAPASTTAHLVHQWTGGNPRLATELVRHGLAIGALVEERGLWWWRGPISVPPQLAELLPPEPRRLSPAQLDALAAVAGSSRPLAIVIVDRIAPKTVDTLEDLGLLQTAEADGEVVARFANPLMQQLVWSRTSPLRRKRVATAMLRRAQGVEADPLVVLQRLETGAAVHAGSLARIARGLRPHSPEMAARMARKAHHGHGGAAVALAGALAELGATREAQSVLHQAIVAHPSATGRALIAAALAMHRCLCERDPDAAHTDLRALREAAPTAALDAIDATGAIVLLLAQRTGDTLRTRRDRPATLTHRLATATALALSGRTREAAASCASLTADAAPEQTGLALALEALIGLWREGRARPPATDPLLGRWPRTPGPVPGTPLHSVAWPLFTGYALLSSGEFAKATGPLREALTQQATGLRPFRSEAAAWLAVSLAATGEPEAAQAILDHEPPDALALLPGLRPWAAGAIAAARGDMKSARHHLDEAAGHARAAEAYSVELQYLTWSAWSGHGQPDELTEQIPPCLARVDAPRLLAEAHGGLALLSRDGPGLFAQAETLAEMGLHRRSWRLAETAAQLLSAGDPGYGAAAALTARLRAALGITSTDAPQAALTVRETEVGALAATGLSNRDIAARLVLSVRTVESHLVRIYRKLGVGSRQELRVRWFGQV
ncbi:LuxR family transcriptional regulator [Actinorhabdospora filicis]|uniref:LuxR family transcriptional regulator n=1 Tax=Actinorhabdospora filicis TaxID=1785913 RepID=A0A9W6SLI4_9ACTN|nr:LuxR C-terminal-related transcriptional regulator [Actinorhabdospora filicis]GLZ78453.1 LuxR family transcriptional regulator [Actinorhabdospora filicis]